MAKMIIENNPLVSGLRMEYVFDNPKCDKTPSANCRDCAQVSCITYQNVMASLSAQQGGQR